MLERIADLPAGVYGVRATGRVSREDYEAVIDPLIDAHGVLVLEPNGRLRTEDFEALGATVDPWIESGGRLRGVVVHAREFSGWENIGSFFRHLRFVRQHQRDIARVALAVDGKLAKLAPVLVEVFVGAEVQHFGFDELDRAVAWVSPERSR